MDDRLDVDALDVDLGDRLQVDAAVLEDAGHGAAQHAVEGDRLGPLASGAAAAEDGDGVGEAADQRGAVVDAQEVVEDLGVAAVVLLHLPQFLGLLVDDGLDAAGDGDEGTLRGVTQVLLVVDDLEDPAEQHLLVRGEVPPGRVEPRQVAHHLVRLVAGVQVAEAGGEDLLDEVLGLRVVGGDPRLQIRTVTLVLGARLPQYAAAAHRLGRGGGHQQGRYGTAHADGGPGGLRHQGDGGSGRRGHHYGRQQQHACVRKVDTRHVSPLKRID